MTTPDVPQEAVEAVLRERNRHYPMTGLDKSFCGCRASFDSDRERDGHIARAALTAALPLIEAVLREQWEAVADEWRERALMSEQNEIIIHAERDAFRREVERLTGFLSGERAALVEEFGWRELAEAEVERLTAELAEARAVIERVKLGIPIGLALLPDVPKDE